ncbi:LIC12048 family lipoprotein [Leptospira venezuelensis]|uniref:LIC12048 family lipoprotein n=1 Tax=Leptospira venezuelensis TaxID=1958811 RepID=UPI000A382CC7|nr:LIC12048 family lipoprotein [Leptospira venezuelensis]
MRKIILGKMHMNIRSLFLGFNSWTRGSFLITTLSFSLFGSCMFFAEDGGDVDLSTAIKLTVEKVPLVKEPKLPAPNHLFDFAPGTEVNAAALGGAIDPTGTNIINDFDGDGILNVNETTTNVWVADYPQVNTIVAPPVTMKVEILYSAQHKSDEIISEISSQDFESTRNQGSENIHQNEVSLRTVQYEDTYGSSLTVGIGGGSGVDGGVTAGDPVSNAVTSTGSKNEGTGINYSNNSSKSWGGTYSTNKTVTKWADKPFKNNLDREGWSVKANSSSDKARKFRREKSQKIDESSKVDPNAGYVRAALYIENQSVNMPVKLKNILCSLMFESAQGDLIPIQSFRLRNADYSLFEVSVYGGTKFGPYVIELDGLNTAEVERAIASGYTPKIYIVDYEMAHVPDSNYKSILVNFSGDNLKIVEENAKARTALIRIFGPGFREMYRVAAFDAVGADSDPCKAKTATKLVPGISLRKALDRITCSGIAIEYEDTIVNFEEIAPKIDKARIFSSGIKSIGGTARTVPCTPRTNIVGSDGNTRSACEQDPLNAWDEKNPAAKENAGFWVVFSKGKYYNFTEYVMQGQDPNKVVVTFDPGSPKPAQVLKGIDSTLWAGDQIDIVYISLKDSGAKIKDFGTSPLVTNLPFAMNTVWDKFQLGDTPYYPTKNSKYLGAVGFGERVNIQIKLDQTRYLNPNFGSPEIGGSFQYFTNFSYDMKRSPTNDLYEYSQIADFEISMGFGGQRTDWLHIEKDINTTGDPYKLQSCGVNFVLVTQTLTLCLQLPSQHLYVDPDTSVIELYLRPAYNNAYRQSVWPLHYSQVSKMRGQLATSIDVGQNTIQIYNSGGRIDSGDLLSIGDKADIFTVSTTPEPPDSSGITTIALSNPTTFKADKTTLVSTKGSLIAADVKIMQDTGFASQWNTDYLASFVPTAFMTAQNLDFLTSGSLVDCVAKPKHPANCLGIRSDYNAINWIGNYNGGVAAWSSWADGGDFSNFLANGLVSLNNSLGKLYQLLPGSSDAPVSQHASGTSPLTGLVTVSSGDFALAIWKRDTGLYGRFYKLSAQTEQGFMGTGTPNGTLGSQLNTTPITGEFTAKVNENGKVIICWENGNEIWVNFYDLGTQTRLYADAKAMTRHGLATNFSAAIGTNYAIVTWDNVVANNLVYDDYVDTRIYNLSTGAGVNLFGIAHYIPNWLITNRLPYYVAVSASGNKAFLVYLQHASVQGEAAWSMYANIDGVVIDMATATKVGSNFALARHNLNMKGLSSGFKVGMFGNRGILTYRMPNSNIYARGVNLDTPAALGTGPFLVDSNVSLSSPFQLTVSQNPGLISYSSATNEARLRALALTTGELLYNRHLVLNNPLPATARNVSSPVIANGNIIFTAWEHAEGTGRTIRGRLASLSSFSNIGNGEFFLSTKNAGIQTTPSVEVGGSTVNGVAFWTAPNETPLPMIRRYAVNLQNPGALQYGLNNFFVAPLIERDYTITTQIKY